MARHPNSQVLPDMVLKLIDSGSECSVVDNWYCLCYTYVARLSINLSIPKNLVYKKTSSNNLLTELKAASERFSSLSISSPTIAFAAFN